MTDLRMGIMGTGGIAQVMADTVGRMEGVRLAAVASRRRDTTEDFAKQNGAERAYDFYEGLAADPNVDLVYVSSPPLSPLPAQHAVFGKRQARAV